jgi:hypothetical protein
MKSSKTNKRALPSNERRRLAIGYYDYTSSNYANWRPWGLYDHKHIPRPSEAAFSNALQQLKAENPVDRETLLNRLTGIAERYWEVRRRVERPPVKWSRDYVQSIRNEIKSLLRRLKSGKSLQIFELARLTQYHTGRSLLKKHTRAGYRTGRSLLKKHTRAGDPESIEQMLEQLLIACDRRLRQKDRGGARKGAHVVAAARQAVKLWEEINQKSMGLSLDTVSDGRWNFGPSKQAFTYPGPVFVQTVLQGIDPALNVTTIGTALRDILGKSGRRKS